MSPGGLVEQVERLETLDVSSLSNDDALVALADARRVQSWIESRTAALRRRIRETAVSPTVGRDDANEVAGSASSSGKRDDRRADAAESIPEVHEAWELGVLTGDHVDAVAATLASLNAQEQQQIAGLGARLVEMATQVSPDGFRDALRDLADALRRDRGESLCRRRKRNTRLIAWVDQHTGMWRLRGQFDPELAATMKQQLEAALRRRFAQPAPDCCPDDRSERVDFLRAHALADLFASTRGPDGGGCASGVQPEVTIVVTVPEGRVDAGAGVDVSPEFVADLMRRGDGRLFTVTTQPGVVVTAPGRLDLGRATRLANRAQRRALHALYAACAVPGCYTDYRLCRLHHVQWWRHGGRTDLDNLLPLCGLHHRAVHEEGWLLQLGPRRELTVIRPDGVTFTTGPPGRGP